MSIEIVKVAGKKPVFQQYSGEHKPQPAFIELIPGEELLTAGYSGIIGSGVPVEVAYQQWLRWYINHRMSARAINQLMQELAPLAQTICDGYEERWNGHNMVGAFDEDAYDAMIKINQICQGLV